MSATLTIRGAKLRYQGTPRYILVSVRTGDGEPTRLYTVKRSTRIDVLVKERTKKTGCTGRSDRYAIVDTITGEEVA